MRRKTFFLGLLGLCFLLNTLGCEAVARKFTRKKKGEDTSTQEMVLAPEEYKSDLTAEQQYRQYLLYWKSWQDELIGSLSTGANHKKQIDCANEAIKNLLNLRVFLKEDTQKKLDGYIAQLENLKEAITNDVYGNSISGNRSTAEQIKRSILKLFSYGKIKHSLS